MKHFVFTQKQVTNLGRLLFFVLLFSSAHVPINKVSNPSFHYFENPINNSSTPIYLANPELRVAMHIAGVDCATNGASGNFDLIFEVIVQNTGDCDLTNFSLIHDMANVAMYGTAFVSVVQPPQIVATGSQGTVTNAMANPTVNAGYNGSNDLLSGGGTLQMGEIFVLQFRVQINPSAGGAPANPGSFVAGSADTVPATMPITDNSDSGYVPNSNNTGRPGDTGGHDDPTPLTNCWSLIRSGVTCNNMVQVSVNQNCIADLTPEMILEGEYGQCAGNSGLFPLGSYYRIISVTTINGIPVPDGNPATKNVYEVPGSFIGTTMVAKVSDVVFKNMCWGQFKLEDKTGPMISCTDPAPVSCDTPLSTIPGATATDNCGGTPIVSLIMETITDNDICDDMMYQIQRTYKAFDTFGNMSATCTQTVTFNRPTIDFPEDIVWHCHQYTGFPNIVNPTALNPAITDSDLMDPDIDVMPNVASNILSNTGSGTVGNTAGVCMYNVSNSDQKVAACGNSFKIIRTWVVMDWCTNQFIITGVGGEDNQQIIYVKDNTAPTLERPDFSVNVNIAGGHPQPCRSTGMLLPPTDISDNCNSVTIRIMTPIGEANYINGSGANGGFIPSPGLPVGTYNISYIATDACNNQSTTNVMVTVVDNVTPTAICDELTEVSLSSDGFATVFATTFDEGSHDNCCLDRVEVKRDKDLCDDGHDDLVFGPSVVFCCADVIAAPTVVIFRAYDCNNNFNDCKIFVNVRDKIAPTALTCPPDQRITCDLYMTNFETQLEMLAGNQPAQNELFDAGYGSPTFADNCGFTVAKGFTTTIDQCKEGTLVRTWMAEDPSNNESLACTQTIFVDHVSDWVVSFPPDVTLNCGTMLPPPTPPTIFFKTCEMIAISYVDEEFITVPNACFKFNRTWTVINWCVVGSSIDQEVEEEPETVLNLDLNGDNVMDARTFRDSWRSGPAANRPTAAQANQAMIPDTDPDSDPWDGLIKYSQIIKVVDNVKPVFPNGCAIPDVVITSTTCTTTVTLPTPIVQDCSPNLTITANGTLGVGLGPFNNVTLGTYDVTYLAMDNCNNQMTCSTTLTVRDGTLPTPICEEAKIIELGPGSMSVTVNASDYNKDSFDNCTPQGSLIYSFSMNPMDQTMTFNCDNRGENLVQIWVTDAAGNQDYCDEVRIIVQDNNMVCPPDDPLVVNIAGSVVTASSQQVENVVINMNGQSEAHMMTGADGSFQFTGIPTGHDLTITPSKNDDPLNGVSTFDLVLISKHILNVQALDSPYKLIAADANNSNSVTTFDLVEIRKLILFVNTSFTNNTSWRFVKKDFTFPVPSNPWATKFPEVININNIPADVLNADFVAIKTGDVNNSAAANLTSNYPEGRNALKDFVIKVSDEEVWTDEYYTVDFRAHHLQLTGFQFTMQFDPNALSLVEIVPGSLINESNFGPAFLKEGILTASWNAGSSAMDLPDGQTLFSIKFQAMRHGKLSSFISVNSNYTPAEAYDEAEEILGVKLDFDLAPQEGHFELYQNRPNPFRQTTTIGFRLPNDAPAKLTITDLSGRVLKVVDGKYSKGYNAIELHRNDLGSNGLIYYRLDTPKHTAIKKAVLMD